MTGYRHPIPSSQVPTTPITATVITKNTQTDFQYILRIERECQVRTPPSTFAALSPTPKVNTYERTPRARAFRTPLYHHVPISRTFSISLVRSPASHYPLSLRVFLVSEALESDTWTSCPSPPPHLDVPRGSQSQSSFRLGVVPWSHSTFRSRELFDECRAIRERCSTSQS